MGEVDLDYAPQEIPALCRAVMVDNLSYVDMMNE